MKPLLSLCLLLFSLLGLAQENTMKIYLAPQIGTGTFMDPFRSKLNDYIDVQTGESFDEIDNPARRYSICLVEAAATTHAAISSDPDVIAVTPNDVAPEQLQALLDTNISSLPIAFRQNLAVKFEEKGISFAWIGASNTVRDAIRYLLRIHFFAQRVDREGNAGIKTFLLNNLDTTVGSVPLKVRKAVKTWMENKGLSTEWITTQTTVRQVLHSIVNDLGFGVIKIGGYSF